MRLVSVIMIMSAEGGDIICDSYLYTKNSMCFLVQDDTDLVCICGH